jgi:maleylpyruvate isomerase
LLQVRRGTAYFARKLNELRDDELEAPSLLAGWTRRHVIAHVGYNARGVARLTQWAGTGAKTPMYDSPAQRAWEIEFGATLSPAALRHLFEHSAVHLNVEWRDLTDEQWAHFIRTAQGRIVHATEMVWMRTREVWIHAIDLDNGGTFHDVPVPLLEHLLEDITGTWARRGQGSDLVLKVTDSEQLTELAVSMPAQPQLVSGSLTELAAWATGRLRPSDSFARHIPGPAPRWL